MLNHITVMGRLARDPELRHTQNGTSVASFRLAVDRDFKDKETGERGVDWIDCVAWRSAGEFVSKYLAKGRLVVVEGRLQIRDWTDKDGNKRSSAEIVVANAYFADSRKPDGQSSGGKDKPRGDDGFELPDGFQPGGGSFAELADDSGDLPF